MHRVFFDSNDGSREFGYMLFFSQSIIDLDRIGEELKPGLEVVLYMPNELEVEAVLKFDDEMGCWVGYPTGAFRDLFPESTA